MPFLLFGRDIFALVFRLQRGITHLTTPDQSGPRYSGGFARRSIEARPHTPGLNTFWLPLLDWRALVVERPRSRQARRRYASVIMPCATQPARQTPTRATMAAISIMTPPRRGSQRARP